MIVANYAAAPMKSCKMVGKKMKIASRWVGNHSFICYKSLISALQTYGLC